MENDERHECEHEHEEWEECPEERSEWADLFNFGVGMREGMMRGVMVSWNN